MRMKEARRAHQAETAKVKREVAAYEERHHMTSDQMRARLAADEIEETWEICQWLLDLHRLELMRGQKLSPADISRSTLGRKLQEGRMATKSVRELARERGTTEDGRILAPGDSRAAIKTRKAGSAPTPRKSFLEAGFRMRQRVSIVRDEHNYYDGDREGIITYLTDHECMVTGADGMKYHIRRAGDIWPA